MGTRGRLLGLMVLGLGRDYYQIVLRIWGQEATQMAYESGSNI